MKKTHDFSSDNIADDNIKNMINNGDIDYNPSPCVVMNNLLKNHNQLADEMGNTSMSSSAIKTKARDSSSRIKIINSNENSEKTIKEFDPPVDYETAFGEYYPEAEKNMKETFNNTED